MPDTSTLCEQAIEILQATRDGDDLAPQHLKLVEMAVNGHLNERGLAAFASLLDSVRKGYTKPWLHDIEHLTIDHAGYVSWKGQQVEHYASRLAHSEDGRAQALEVARRCAILEARGDPITPSTVIWHWNETDPGRRR